MATRKVLVTVVGHVDHGKTSLLDKIRRTVVANREAGAITQAIGVSIIPLNVIKKVCGKLLDVFKGGLTVPGLLCIDTPGHAAFTSLRKRGGSLADIAILVVDINEGFKPQTIESIEILKANKVPFIVAANKVDLLPIWKGDSAKFLLENINAMDYSQQGEFEKKIYELVGQFGELELQAERFDRVDDYTKQVAIIPISAKTGQGIPELLMVLTGLAQRYLEKKLQIDEEGPGKGTILEVKEEKGLGMTIDTIIYNGTVKVGDTLVIGDVNEPFTVKVRALLEPAELAEMREKGNFKNVKEVHAATGVKIAAPGLDKAIAGMPVRVVSGDLNSVVEEVKAEVGEVLVGDDSEQGVMIKADTIGGLEALRNLLEEKGVPIASSSLGDVTKKDLSQLEALREKDPFTGVLLGFNMKLPGEISELASAKNLKIITHDVIYKTIEDYEEYTEKLREDIEKKKFNSLVRPCKFAVLKGYVFRQSNPAIVGVEIEIGKIKVGDPILTLDGRRISSVKSMKEGKENVLVGVLKTGTALMKKDGKEITTVKSMQHEKESINTAEKGKQVAAALNKVTVGRQIEEGDFLYTDVPEEDFKQLKKLKKHLSDIEKNVLREIAEIKRKNNPVWGVG